MPLIGQKLRGVADVVFVMDRSPSMDPVIEAVKAHVAGFVDSIHRNSQMPLDVRLGLVSHYSDGGDRRGTRHWDFTTSVDEFKDNIAKCDRSPASGDEYGLPALDRALDFPWRPLCRRFVVSFTDEPVAGGCDVEFQQSKLSQLAAKFEALRVSGYLIGPECPDYDTLCQGPRMVRVVLNHGELAGYDFGKFFSSLGRTVSAAPDQEAGGPVTPNLYGL